jgi:outer membrane receptor for ferrienterochelin and colicins
MRQLIMTAMLLLLPYALFSQSLVRGKVTDKNHQPVAGAAVYSMDSSVVALTDSSGQFSLQTDHAISRLVVWHRLYVRDTVEVSGQTYIELPLRELQVLTDVTVKASGRGSSLFISTQTMKTEVITSGELKKAACCDLAGCFETQGTVQPMTTNIITNSKELRILGLSGVYNQVLIDGMPLIQGLSYTYGISSIPGTLVENIYVAKGTTSVLQGYESMVGQINVIPKPADKGDRMLLNVYMNSFGESHYNVNYRMGKGKLSNLLSAHMVQPAQKWDRDHDGFLDLPQLTRYMLYDKMKYGDENKKGFSSMLGLRYVWEQRSGGQLGFDPRKDVGSTTVYGQHIKYSQPEIYSKTGFRFDPSRKITLIASGFAQDQASWFGSVNYKAKQQNAYANLQYEQEWRNRHELKAGVSYRYMRLDERIAFSDTFLKRTYAGNYLKLEKIPGFFAENTFSWRGDIITLITGIRADHHNSFGWEVTPRAMLKYELTEKAVLRASAGTGWRTVNLFSENIGLMVSSRDIVFKDKLLPEKAVNWGLNVLQKFTRKHVEGFMTLDFYQTRFQRQFFPDYDTDPTKAFIGNFSGPSVSNGLQADLNAKFYKLLEAKVAYNFLDVYRITDGVKRELPFNARHKFLLSLSYLPKSKKWRVDMNAHWFGRQRLPDTEGNPEAFRQAGTSSAYTTFNIQLTKSWKQLELYGGCENLFDFRQLKPIVSWQNPFSPYFDTSFNWGPTRGREIYLGIRYKPFKNKS